MVPQKVTGVKDNYLVIQMDVANGTQWGSSWPVKGFAGGWDLEVRLRFPACDVSANHIQVLAGGFEGLLGIVVRNKSGIVIEGQISLPPKTIKDGQQTAMFLVNASPNEFDHCDVVSWLASGTKPVAEHEPEGSLEHCFVGLLKTGFLIKGENFVSRGEFLIRARKEAVNLRPVNGVRFEFFHANL